jgi:hypothetical protein
VHFIGAFAATSAARRAAYEGGELQGLLVYWLRGRNEGIPVSGRYPLYVSKAVGGEALRQVGIPESIFASELQTIENAAKPGACPAR